MSHNWQHDEEEEEEWNVLKQECYYPTIDLLAPLFSLFLSCFTGSMIYKGIIILCRAKCAGSGIDIDSHANGIVC